MVLPKHCFIVFLSWSWGAVMSEMSRALLTDRPNFSPKAADAQQSSWTSPSFTQHIIRNTYQVADSIYHIMTRIGYKHCLQGRLFKEQDNSQASPQLPQFELNMINIWHRDGEVTFGDPCLLAFTSMNPVTYFFQTIWPNKMAMGSPLPPGLH